jgi:glycosyltransferase involved in cell wall biosynthesis
MTSKTVSLIFPVMCQSLLKPHYVYTAWLHKISPPLIVCRICFVNSIRNLRHGFADNRSNNSIHQNHFPVYLEFVWRNLSFWSNHCWFMIQGQSWSVPMAHLWLLFMKMGYQEENYNFWDFSTIIFDIKCWLWMKLAPALVPLEVWFWYMLFLDLLSAKWCLRFLIELIEQILSKSTFYVKNCSGKIPKVVIFLLVPNFLE